MGPEVEMRLSKHRRRKWQVFGSIHNQLNHFHSINIIKGESTMKAKKRFLGIILAVLMVCAMALPASAANNYYHGAYEDTYCEATAACYTNSFNCNTYCEDHTYFLRTDVIGYERVLVTKPNGVSVYQENIIFSVHGNESLIRCTNSGSSLITLYKVKSDHFVNDDHIITLETIAG